MSRILCVADEFPWPPTSGYRIRLANALAGLAEVGEVDLFCSIAERPDVAEGEHPAPAGKSRDSTSTGATVTAHSARGLLRWVVSGLPRARRVGSTGAVRPPTSSGGRRLGTTLVWFSHCHGLGGHPPWFR